MNETSAFYAIKSAVERSHPDLINSIQGRHEIERIALEITAAIKAAGLRLVSDPQLPRRMTR